MHLRLCRKTWEFWGEWWTVLRFGGSESCCLDRISDGTMAGGRWGFGTQRRPSGPPPQRHYDPYYNGRGPRPGPGPSSQFPRGHPPPPPRPDAQEKKKSKDDVLKNDLVTERPLWVLSCYSAVYGAHKDVGFDTSPEELRYHDMKMLKQGVPPQEVQQKVQQVAEQADAQLKAYAERMGVHISFGEPGFPNPSQNQSPNQKRWKFGANRGNSPQNQGMHLPYAQPQGPRMPYHSPPPYSQPFNQGGSFGPGQNQPTSSIPGNATVRSNLFGASPDPGKAFSSNHSAQSTSPTPAAPMAQPSNPAAQPSAVNPSQMQNGNQNDGQGPGNVGGQGGGGQSGNDEDNPWLANEFKKIPEEPPPEKYIW